MRRAWVGIGMVCVVVGGVAWLRPGLPGSGPASAGPGPTADAEAALAHAVEAISAARRAGDIRAESAALQSHATLLDARGRFPEAVEDLLVAVSLGLAKDDPGVVHDAWTAFEATCARWRRQPEGLAGVVTAGNRLHALFARAERRADAAQVRHNVGVAAIDAERLDDARAWLGEALAARRALAEAAGPAGRAAHETPVAWSANALGYACYRAKAYDEAATHCFEAYRLSGGRGLTGPAGQALGNLQLIITAWREAGQVEQALALARKLRDQVSPGGSVEERELLGHRHMALCCLTGQLPEAETVAAELRALARSRRPPYPYAEATLAWQFANLLLADADAPDRALAPLAEAEAIQREIRDDKGRGWTMVSTGRAHLALAKAAQAAGDAAALRAAGERAAGAFATACRIFQECGEDRDGLHKTFEYWRDLETLRGNAGESAFRREQMQAVLEKPPPVPEEPRSFAPAGTGYAAQADILPPDAGICRVIRDSGGWLVRDGVDGIEMRVPFSWRVRTVAVRRVSLEVHGGMVRCGPYACFVQEGHGAEISRAGVLAPTGPDPELRGLPPAAPPEPGQRDGKK